MGKESKNGDMILKMDVGKACDRVDWLFLQETLSMFGFPAGIINLILHGITSSKMSLLWKGSRMEGFASHRGLQQGDPLLRTFLFFAWRD